MGAPPGFVPVGNTSQRISPKQTASTFFFMQTDSCIRNYSFRMAPFSLKRRITGDEFRKNRKAIERHFRSRCNDLLQRAYFALKYRLFNVFTIG
jgi:hypothetical protein